MEKPKVISCINTAINDNIIKGKFLENRKVFEFNPIDNIDSKGNKSTWVISVYARNKETNKNVSIDKEWITCPILKQPKNIVGVIQTVIKRHTGHLQVNDETIVEVGKNIGKLNATTPISQAFSEAYRKHTNKLKMSNNKIKSNSDIRPFPMLLKKSGVTKSATLTDSDFKDGVAVQPKLDGIRAIAHILSDQTVEFYSRKGLAFTGLDNISNEVCMILSKAKEPTEFYLDGEIYIHNTPLQQLSGAVRGENNELKNELAFYVFDVFSITNKDMTQKERFEILHTLIKKDYKYVKIVPTKIVHSREELDKIYNDFIKNQGYEGAIARRLSGVYKFGIGNQRSDDVLKIKPFSTDEFKIVDYKDGRGRDKGAVTFILETKKGNEFSAVPNMSLEERKELFEKFEKSKNEFKNKYKDKMATIQYADLSTKGVPTQPKWIALRDYE